MLLGQLLIDPRSAHRRPPPRNTSIGLVEDFLPVVVVRNLDPSVDHLIGVIELDVGKMAGRNALAGLLVHRPDVALVDSVRARCHVIRPCKDMWLRRGVVKHLVLIVDGLSIRGADVDEPSAVGVVHLDDGQEESLVRHSRASQGVDGNGSRDALRVLGDRTGRLRQSRSRRRPRSRCRPRTHLVRTTAWSYFRWP